MKKLDQLKQGREENYHSQRQKYKFALKIVNIIIMNFTQEEVRLLNKGNKFNIKEPTNDKKLEELTVNCEQIIQTIEYDLRQETRTNRQYISENKTEHKTTKQKPKILH